MQGGGDAALRWDFTNSDGILASYLSLDFAKEQMRGEGDQPAASEEGRRWDFTNSDEILASYLGLYSAKEQTSREGDRPAASEEGWPVETAQLTEGAQASLWAVSLEGGPQALGSVWPHAELPLPTAPSDEMPDQDSRRALGRREPPLQIGQLSVSFGQGWAGGGCMPSVAGTAAAGLPDQLAAGPGWAG